MKKLKEMIIVDGYNPFGIFNLILSAVSGCIIALSIAVLTSLYSEGYTTQEIWQDALGNSPKYLVYFLVAIVCFLIVLFRNRKLKSTPKMIIFSVLSSVLGVIVAIIAIILFILIVISGDSISDKIKIPSGTDSNDNKFKKQYSNTKGEYSTDGQGNFKDQYGNDVYNPQGVSDYDKL